MNVKNRTIDEREVNKFAALSAKWWDSEGPLKTLHDINPARLNFVAQHLAVKGLSILDVGCGGGILSEGLAQMGALVTGIDAEAQAIQTASEHASNAQLSIGYECTAIEDFDAPGFDAVVCMELLEHVQHPDLVLQHCKRLLKPEGLLFVSTINRGIKAYASAIIAAEYLLGLLPRQTHDFAKFIKPSELAAMARSLDLELVDMQGLEYNPFSRQAWLSADVSTNYLMVFRR